MAFKFNGEIIECSKPTALIIRSVAWECYVESANLPKVNTIALSLFNAINDAFRDEESGDE